MISSPLIIILWSTLPSSLLPVRLLIFPGEQAVGSGARLDYPAQYEEQDITICLDIFITSIRGSVNLISSDQFSLIIPSHQDKFLIQWKGIWYYAFHVPDISPLTWGRVCLSYSVITHTVMLVYRGQVVLTISDPGLLGARTIQRTFLQNIVLGKKDNTGSFIGRMTGFSVQEYAGAFTRLQSESDCPRRSTNMELGNIFLLELAVAWDIFGERGVTWPGWSI